MDILGWVSLLNKSYLRRFDIFNRGYSGYNSRWVYLILEDILSPFIFATSPKVQLITIFLGANDAAFEHRSQHQSIEDYTVSLKNILSVIEANLPSTNIILMTPPPICDSLYSKYCETQGKDIDRTNKNTLKYIEACRQVGYEKQQLQNMNEGGKNKIAIADTYSYFMKVAHGQNEGLQKYMDDGLHFTAEGHQLVFDLVSQTIEENFPEMKKKNVDFDGPSWADIEKDTKQIDRWGLKKTPLKY